MFCDTKKSLNTCSYEIQLFRFFLIYSNAIALNFKSYLRIYYQQTCSQFFSFKNKPSWWKKPRIYKTSTHSPSNQKQYYFWKIQHRFGRCFFWRQKWLSSLLFWWKSTWKFWKYGNFAYRQFLLICYWYNFPCILSS